MRDEIDGRLWTAHHENFDDWVNQAAALLRAGLARLGSWDGSASHLLSLVASIAITAFTVKSTAI